MKYIFKNADCLHRFIAKGELQREIGEFVGLEQFAVDGRYISRMDGGAGVIHIPQGYHGTILSELDYFCSIVPVEAAEVGGDVVDTRETKFARLCQIIKDGKFKQDSDYLIISPDFSIRFFEDRGLYSVISVIDGRDFDLFSPDEENQLVLALEEYKKAEQKRVKENLFMSRSF